MKVLVTLACVLGLTNAEWISNAPAFGYKGPTHIPVIHNGVPTETPEVQHAKAAHYAAVRESSSRSGYQAIEAQPHVKYDNNAHHEHGYNFHAIHDAPALVHHATVPDYYAPAPVEHISVQYSSNAHVKPAYQTSHVLPAIDHNGNPLDTPEVEQAKQDHFAEFHKALAATAPHQPEEPQQNYYSEPTHYYRQRRSIHVPDVPIEPVEVQQARAAHLAAHRIPSHGYKTVQVHAPIYGLKYDHWIPMYDHHGLPLDVLEVEHAKQAHFAAHKEANQIPILDYESKIIHAVPFAHLW